MRSAILFYTFTEAKTIVLKATVEDKSSPTLSFRDLRGNVAHPVAHGSFSSFLNQLFPETTVSALSPFQRFSCCSGSVAVKSFTWGNSPRAVGRAGTSPLEVQVSLGHARAVLRLCRAHPQGVSECNFPCRHPRAQG